MPLEHVPQVVSAEAAAERATSAAMSTPTYAWTHVTAAAALVVVYVTGAAATALISETHTVMAENGLPGSQPTATVFLPEIH